MFKIKYIVLYFLFFTTSIIKAQADFRPGYVIKENGDTLWGEIDSKGDLIMGSLCIFKLKGQDSETIYHPSEISAFRFINSKYFVSKEYEKGKNFFEFLIQGKVNIYYLRDEKGDHYYLEKEGQKMIELPYEEEVRYIDGKSYLYKSKKHIGILNFYLQDAPGFQSKINKIKKPEHKNLIKLAEEYHNSVCNSEKCIIYEKIMPSVKVNLEIVGGLMNYTDFLNLGDKCYFQGGVLVHFWMPRVNEKLYFRTGTLFSNVYSDYSQGLNIKLPIQIEYLFPWDIVKPKMAYGINIYPAEDQTVAFMCGLDVKLYKSIYWSINFDFDYYPSGYVLFPDINSKYSKSLLSGLCIAF